MYLVIECNTKSIPKLQGFCKKGEAKVLSTTDIKLWDLAKLAMNLRSVIFNNGFEGDSIQISFVFGVKSSSILLRLFGSR